MLKPPKYQRENSNNQTTPFDRALGDSGEQKLPFTGRDFLLCHDWLGVLGGRRDKRQAVMA